MELHADFIIIGSGIAALRAAAELSGAGDILILTKAEPEEGNTGYAQGGVAAAVGPQDSPALHASDTMAAGDGLCDEDAVRVLAEEGPDRVRELMAWGARFDLDPDGTPALAMEGAHSARRVLHARDATGREIGGVLWRRTSTLPGVSAHAHARVVDLVVREGRCTGACFIGPDGGLNVAHARVVLLATGGAGRVYRETTNPAVATGDGIAMGYRAGAAVTDLEFVQFHPTALKVEGQPRFLLSEALRGEGAHLENADGEAFMARYETAADLASRDRVSRAIVREEARTGRPVFLTLRNLDPDYVHTRFPLIADACRRAGLDLARDPIPVGPAAHYVMGGLVTDLDGWTTVPGLFAAGEVACTGVHGANRLASNSLLEGLVFGARAGRAMRSAGADGRPRHSQGRTQSVGLPPVAQSAKAGLPPVAQSAKAGLPPVAQSAKVGLPPAARSAKAGLPPVAQSAKVGLPPAARSAKGGAISVARVRDLMWTNVGLFRAREALQDAVDELEFPWQAATKLIHSAARLTVDDWKAANLLTVARLIARAALRREESRGAHYRDDYPERDDINWKKRISETIDQSLSA